MQMKLIPNGRAIATLGAAIKSMTLSKAGLALCGLFLLAFVMPAVAQETVFISALNPSRVTVPLNYSGTNLVGMSIQLPNGTNEVDLTVSGAPAGATATLSRTAF